MPERTASDFERAFARAGLPYFSIPYQRKSVTGQLTTFATVVAVVELLVPALLAQSGKLASLLVAFSVFVGGFALLNTLRSRRPLARPSRPGLAEATWFVAVPALILAVNRGDWMVGVTVALLNAALLAGVLAARRFAVVFVARWTLRHLRDQIAGAYALLIRALPFLFLVVLLVFYTADPWQLTTTLPWPLLIVALATFTLLAFGLAAARADEQLAGALATSSELSTVEQRNCRMVVVVSQLVVAAVVASATFGALVALGTFTVPVELLTRWTGTPPAVLWSFTAAGTELAVSVPLLKVAALLAGFAGLQFTVALLSGTADGDFLQATRAHLNKNLQERETYLELYDPRW